MQKNAIFTLVYFVPLLVLNSCIGRDADNDCALNIENLNAGISNITVDVVSFEGASADEVFFGSLNCEEDKSYGYISAETSTALHEKITAFPLPTNGSKIRAKADVLIYKVREGDKDYFVLKLLSVRQSKFQNPDE